MTTLELDAMDSPAEATPAAGRFACPHCGTILRVGAIMCPQCEADLWTMSRGGPTPSAGAENPVEDAPLPTPASEDAAFAHLDDALGAGRPAAVKYGLILVMAAVAYITALLITWSIDRVIGTLVR